MPEREYVITEYFVTHQDIYVRARSKAEALERVNEGITRPGDIYPKRPMSVHDVRVSKGAVVCEVCGGMATSNYRLGVTRERGRCGDHLSTEPGER